MAICIASWIGMVIILLLDFIIKTDTNGENKRSKKS